MTTQISDLPNNSQHLQNENDNSKIVNEILQEMNTESPVQEGNTHMLQRQIDPNINLQVRDNLEPQVAPSTKPVITSSIESIKDKVLTYVKDPLIIATITLIVFSPIVYKLLAKSIPKLFASDVVTFRWIALLIKSIVVGTSYYGIKMIIN